MSDHEHKWLMHTHVDGCHWWRSVDTCDCGDTRVVGAERDFLSDDDPYAMVWAVDACDRCQELMKGATPRGVAVEAGPS